MFGLNADDWLELEMGYSSCVLIASFSFDTGEMLGGHVRAVFTLITLIFTVCVVFTVASFKEIPLELQEQVGGGGPQIRVAYMQLLADRPANCY